MKKLVLFGAGVYAKKYVSLLEYLNIDFDYFTDNNERIHGDTLFDKEIIKPEKLVDLECDIIISCTHTQAIKKQLESMGILHKLLDIKDIYQNHVKSLSAINTSEQYSTNKMNILVDMYEGIGWGGTEVWAAEVTKGLADRGYPVILVGSDLQTPFGEEYEKYVRRFENRNTIKEMCEMIEEKLPCVIINNFSGCMFWAASIMKIKYPNQIKIVSVIHNDNIALFEAHMMLKDYIDFIVCVSNKIRNKIIQDYNWCVEKIHFKEQPITFNQEFTRKYWDHGQAIKIGYAGRIVKQQKRADLIPKLIGILEHKQLDYVLEIAGDGECIDLIQKFIKEKELGHKVKVLGRIEKENMPTFWQRQDIFISISEYEGASLAMLEAMSYGCVPVVTEVSGVKEFIQQGINGYICKVGHIEDIVDSIEKFITGKSDLKAFSKKCAMEIKTRCNKAHYIDYIEQLIRNVWR